MELLLCDWRAILTFVGPALVVYTLVVLVPIVWSLVYTVFEGNVISGFQFVGLNNFATLIRDQTFWQAVAFTLKYAVVVTIGQVAVGLLLALLYVFYLRNASALVRTLIFFPVILPTGSRCGVVLEALRDLTAAWSGKLRPAGGAPERPGSTLAWSGRYSVLCACHHGYLAINGLLRSAALCRAGRCPQRNDRGRAG